MFRRDSNYANHPRVTWFGTGGTVAYVDYTNAAESWFIGSAPHGGFQVIPPCEDDEPVDDDKIVMGFATIDEGIAYALGAVG